METELERLEGLEVISELSEQLVLVQRKSEFTAECQDVQPDSTAGFILFLEPPIITIKGHSVHDDHGVPSS
ncbi:MAG: hypothetical protein ACKOAH_21060 [Pirellula sp.]